MPRRYRYLATRNGEPDGEESRSALSSREETFARQLFLLRLTCDYCGLCTHLSLRYVLGDTQKGSAAAEGKYLPRTS
jgi:hypothetical protein